jgi:5-methylcytosine-specific restriction endonuclease McrA
MKNCSTCKIEKPLTEFYKNLTKKDKLQQQCKECMNFVSQKRLGTEEGFIKNVLQIIFAPSRIKERGYSPSCTQEEVLELYYKHVNENGKNCFYCKIPLTFTSKKLRHIKSNEKGKHIITNFSIDRLNNNETYTIKNIIFCCNKCNLSKNSISISLIKRLYEVITERNL